MRGTAAGTVIDTYIETDAEIEREAAKEQEEIMEAIAEHEKQCANEEDRDSVQEDTVKEQEEKVKVSVAHMVTFSLFNLLFIHFLFFFEHDMNMKRNAAKNILLLYFNGVIS